MDGKRSRDHRLALTIAVILTLTGLCSAVNISPLLSCMMLGTVYINAGGNKRLFKQVNKFTPPILMMFFVLAGLNLNLPSLATAGLIGVVYFLVRILGTVSYTHLRAHETGRNLVCRLLLEKKKNAKKKKKNSIMPINVKTRHAKE